MHPVQELIDEGQITHLICARLKYDLYDFFSLGGVLGLLPVPFLVEKAQKHPLKKSYRSYFSARTKRVSTKGVSMIREVSESFS